MIRKDIVYSTAILFSYLVTFNPVATAQPQLVLPIACTPGVDCWTVNYVDDDPDPGSFKDFNCGPKTYDNHKGTDFAIRDWATMEHGVDVVAAADGTVLRRRNDMADAILSQAALQKLKQANKGCGNGVVIDHGAGWQTIYCHMKQDSIVVAVGDQVRAGQKIGQVGHTGFVEFPHVHLGVFFNDKIIDPYTGLDSSAGCGVTARPLWRHDQAPGYDPVSIYAAGFKDEVPDMAAINLDAAPLEKLPADAPALTFWATMFGALQGDRMVMEIRDPGRQVFAKREIRQDKDRARQFYYVGKRTRGKGLIKGIYTGELKLTRTLQDGSRLERQIKRELIIE